MTYWQYIRSWHWRNVRADAIKREHGRCEDCGSPDNLDVHHAIYPKRWEDDHIGNVNVLCRACHYAEHRKDRANHQAVHIATIIESIMGRFDHAKP